MLLLLDELQQVTIQRRDAFGRVIRAAQAGVRRDDRRALVAIPPGHTRLAARDRIVVRFELSDRRQPNRYWLVLTRAGNEVCLHDPGFVRPSAAEAR
ncbi:MAG TPA: hypothetical protein VGD73_01430 [Pseudonocardia sp.]|uniref:hypothetical protein n=1 Tax=Pseudonocardia sp. TaxID=60912 RepID=UPI002ED86664